MGQDTSIAWTDSSFNSWWGCTKVSAGCSRCYAETFDRRVGGDHWGPGKERRTFGDKHWNEPRKWDREAAKAGRRHRVFCSSMADVFDAEAPEGQLDRLWALIRETPNLDWQLLTKRPERIRESLPPDWGEGYANVWLGTTVEDQRRAEERIPHLLSVPARVRFLSVEPQLEPVTLDRFFGLCPGHQWAECLCSEIDPSDRPCIVCEGRQYLGAKSGISWVVVGGESGGGARPFALGWARSIVAACKQAGVAVFVKQLGAWPFDDWDRDESPLQLRSKGRKISPFLNLEEPKGGDMAEWPEDLRVREFPIPR